MISRMKWNILPVFPEKWEKIVNRRQEVPVADKNWDEKMVELARRGDDDAAEALLQKYKTVVKRRASSYYMAGADRDDVIQEGMIGVFKAIRDYDPEKGASFSTFADLCINRQIVTAVKAAQRYKHSPLNNSMSLSNSFSETGKKAILLRILLCRMPAKIRRRCCCCEKDWIISDATEENS